MKNILVIFFFFGCSVWSFSQKNDTEHNDYNLEKTDLSYSKNSLGLDIGYFNYAFFDGTSALLNYERLLIQNFNLRLGFGYFAVSESKGFTALQFPVTINYLSGKSNNHFELDVGGRLTYFKSALNKYEFPNEYMASLVLNLGYRYQKPTGGFIFKALIGLDGLTLGAGYSF